MPPKKDTKSSSKQPQKTQKKKEGSGGGKAKKKKWSKGKVRDKLNNQVLFDKVTYEKLCKVSEYRLITPSVVSERLKVTVSLAKRALIELHQKGEIKQVVQHHAQLIYTRPWTTKGYVNYYVDVSSKEMCQAMLTLQNEDKTLTFKVKANWEESSFDLTVFADEAWRAFLSKDDIEKLASERNQTANDYYSTLRGYLTDVNPTVCFNLSYEKDGEAVEFTITRKTGARALLFFSSKLKKMDFHKCIYDLLDDLMEKHNELSTRVQALQKEKSDIEREKNIYEDKLIEFIERKTKWEQEMYSNFLLLLNEKKKRIKFLTSILKRKNIDPNEHTLERQSELPSKKRSKRSNRLEQLSDSESSNYSGTDDYDTESSATENAERHEPTPSTSRQNLNLEEPGDGDSHLLLPKRVKEAKNEETIVLKPSPVNEKQADLKECETLTPQLEFSTQELIDRM